MHRNLGQWTHAILRISAGALFMEHGMQKLFGMFGGMGAPGATAPIVSQMGLAGILEFGGGALLLVGLLTQPIAAVLLVEMLVAYFQAHAPQGGWPIQNQGELALLYAAIFVFLAGNGAGAFSLDNWMPQLSRRERRHVTDRRDRIAA